MLRLLKPGLGNKEPKDLLCLRHGQTGIGGLSLGVVCDGAALSSRIGCFREIEGLLTGDGHDFRAAGVVRFEHAVEHTLDERNLVGGMHGGHLRQGIASRVHEREDFDTLRGLVRRAADFHVEGRERIVDGMNVVVEVCACDVAFYNRAGGILLSLYQGDEGLCIGERECWAGEESLEECPVSIVVRARHGW